MLIFAQFSFLEPKRKRIPTDTHGYPRIPYKSTGGYPADTPIVTCCKQPQYDIFHPCGLLFFYRLISRKIIRDLCLHRISSQILPHPKSNDLLCPSSIRPNMALKSAWTTAPLGRMAPIEQAKLWAIRAVCRGQLAIG